MPLFDENLVGLIAPEVDIPSFQATMATPLRIIFQNGLMAMETLLSAAFSLSTNPNNLPLVAMKVFNERAADPIHIANAFIQMAIAGVGNQPPPPGKGGMK